MAKGSVAGVAAGGAIVRWDGVDFEGRGLFGPTLTPYPLSLPYARKGVSGDRCCRDAGLSNGVVFPWPCFALTLAVSGRETQWCWYSPGLP